MAVLKLSEVLQVAISIETNGETLYRHAITLADDAKTKDADLMSGMLVAIQGIAREGLERGGMLRSINYEDNTILMASGGRLYLAVVVYGQPDDALRDMLEETTRQVEASYGDIIDGWDGDLSVFAGVGDVIRYLVDRTRNVTREEVMAAGAAVEQAEVGKVDG